MASRSWAGVTLALLVSFASIGCATMEKALREGPPLAWPAPVGTVVVDREASEVVFRREDSALAAANTPYFVQHYERGRTYIAEQLSTLKGPGTERLPIRFRYVLSEKQLKWPFALIPCMVVGIFIGCPAKKSYATAEVTYDINGRLYSGSATGEAWHGLYYNMRSTNAGLSMAHFRAIVAATRQALAGSPHEALGVQLEHRLTMNARGAVEP